MFLYAIIILLVILFGAQIYLRPFVDKYIIYIFYIFALLIVSHLVYATYLQYDIWKSGNSVAKYLLPPYRSIWYFVYYVIMRIWSQFIVSFFFGVLFYFLARTLNKSHKELIFYKNEYWLILISLFVSGWPTLLFYSISFLAIFLFASIIFFFIKGNDFRLSTYYLWIPVSVFAIIISKAFLVQTVIWRLLKI